MNGLRLDDRAGLVVGSSVGSVWWGIVGLVSPMLRNLGAEMTIKGVQLTSLAPLSPESREIKSELSMWLNLTSHYPKSKFQELGAFLHAPVMTVGNGYSKAYGPCLELPRNRSRVLRSV